MADTNNIPSQEYEEIIDSEAVEMDENNVDDQESKSPVEETWEGEFYSDVPFFSTIQVGNRLGMKPEMVRYYIEKFPSLFPDIQYAETKHDRRKGKMLLSSNDIDTLEKIMELKAQGFIPQQIEDMIKHNSSSGRTSKQRSVVPKINDADMLQTLIQAAYSAGREEAEKRIKEEFKLSKDSFIEEIINAVRSEYHTLQIEAKENHDIEKQDMLNTIHVLKRDLNESMEFARLYNEERNINEDLRQTNMFQENKIKDYERRFKEIEEREAEEEKGLFKKFGKVLGGIFK